MSRNKMMEALLREPVEVFEPAVPRKPAPVCVLSSVEPSSVVDHGMVITMVANGPVSETVLAAQSTPIIGDETEAAANSQDAGVDGAR